MKYILNTWFYLMVSRNKTIRACSTFLTLYANLFQRKKKWLKRQSYFQQLPNGSEKSKSNYDMWIYKMLLQYFKIESRNVVKIWSRAYKRSAKSITLLMIIYNYLKITTDENHELRQAHKYGLFFFYLAQTNG